MKQVYTVLAFLVVVSGAAAAQSEVLEQWAMAVIEPSSMPASGAGGPDMVLGPPNSGCTADVEQFDFITNSWRTLDPDTGEEWIEVRFSLPVYATVVEIYETLNPGAVTSVKVRNADGEWQTVWEGEDPTQVCPGILRTEFASLPYATSEVRVELNTATVPGWNQLDAVKLVGYRAEGVKSLFEEVAPEKVYKPYEWKEIPASIGSYTFGDYDNDGWPDMYGHWGGGYPTSLAMMHNEGDGTYGERSAILPLREVLSTNAGRVFGDYDNDGDLDLYTACGSALFFYRCRDQLWRNEGEGFTDVTAEAGLTDSVMSTMAMWFDYNRDGWLDLYVGHGTSAPPDFALDVPNALYGNNGDGTFADVTKAAGLGLSLRSPGELFEKIRGTGETVIAADFNDDGWPDLQISVPGSANRLLFGDGKGAFRDGTTREVGNLGLNVGAAAGDIDNDGDLDLFQATLGGDELGISGDFPERSVMLLNLGEGQFLDVTEGVGLTAVAVSNIAFARFYDIDNDGDLDLLTSIPFRLFLNDGTGMFTEATFLAGLPGAYVAGDYNGDGFLDVWYEQFFFRNRGNTNHWLRLDLVGTKSNRDGIGARVYARTGAVRQTRELSGGDGWMQDELVVHFGLGQSTVVDEVEIRWPSGQIDVLRDIPADQEIRVIEGRGAWYPAPRTVWETPPPKSVVYGQQVSLAAVCRPALFEPTAQITRVTGDLSGLGGPDAVPLEDLGDGTYRLSADFVVSGNSDLRDVEVFIEQETSLGRQWINLSRNLEVKGYPSTAVEEERTAALPQALSLAQNYPNPFNSQTVIRFALPVSSAVELAVYNLAGQRVAMLVSGTREAGTYAVNWDGRDEQGRELASGVYLYRLRVGEREEMRKLALVR